MIECGKYVYFDDSEEYSAGRFCLTEEAQEIIYRQKEIICSYSGANEWCNHMFCQFIDVFSGASIYNYSLGTVNHEKEIPKIWKENKQSVIEWLLKAQSKEWFIKCCESFDFMFENLPIIE